MFFLVFVIGFASSFAYFGHVSLFVALGTCYVFTFNFANVPFVCAPAPVACNGVRSIGGVS